MRKTINRTAISLFAVGFFAPIGVVLAAESAAPFSCADMIRPLTFREKQLREHKSWHAVNTTKTFRAQGATADSSLSAWQTAHSAFHKNMQEARGVYKRQYTSACRKDRKQNIDIAPDFITVGSGPDKAKRTRVRATVLSRTVGNITGTVSSRAERLKNLVHMGGPGVARVRAHLSVREQRKLFRTTTSTNQHCRGKKARLQCLDQ